MVESKLAVKYLGVMIDSKLGFFEQIMHTAGVMALSWLMANIGGLKPTRRLLMCNCPVSPLYEADVRADSLYHQIYGKKLVHVQRQSTLQVALALSLIHI